MSNFFISVCIPAYKNPEYLKRLLDSIASQTYRDFEVIITDDSPSDEVSQLCDQYVSSFSLQYYKNNSAKGTPENWNEAIRHAKGEWIKLMHDDDWFNTHLSLGVFAMLATQYKEGRFFFSAYNNVHEDNNRVEQIQVNAFRLKKLQKDTMTLFSSNVIGPPSVTLVKRDAAPEYDKRMKWLVDIDFYIRYLENTSPIYIDNPLINVGINKDQVTQSAFRVPAVEIPENFLFLEKMGVIRLRNMLVYDAWWRSIRNLKIRSVDTIRENGYKGEIPSAIRSMISWQRKFPASILKTGLFSKLLMFIHYLFHKGSLKK